MNWPILIIVGILAIALVIFLVKRNWQDEKEFEKQLDDDYPKPPHDTDDIDTDELTGTVH